MKYVFCTIVLLITTMQSVFAVTVGTIDVVSGGHVFQWEDTTSVGNNGFVAPVSIGVDESVVGIRVHSRRTCGQHSTTTGHYTPGKNTIVIPNTPDNDKDVYWSVVIRNTAGAEREIPYNRDSWEIRNQYSMQLNAQADGTYSYGILGDYQDPTVSSDGTNVRLDFKSDILSGFLLQSSPACDINPKNVSVIRFWQEGDNAPIIGTITQDPKTQHYSITFPKVVRGKSGTVSALMYEDIAKDGTVSTNKIRWLEINLFKAEANNSHVELSTTGGSITIR